MALVEVIRADCVRILGSSALINKYYIHMASVEHTFFPVLGIFIYINLGKYLIFHISSHIVKRLLICVTLKRVNQLPT